MARQQHEQPATLTRNRRGVQQETILRLKSSRHGDAAAKSTPYPRGHEAFQSSTIPRGVPWKLRRRALVLIRRWLSSCPGNPFGLHSCYKSPLQLVQFCTVCIGCSVSKPTFYCNRSSSLYSGGSGLPCFRNSSASRRSKHIVGSFSQGRTRK